MKKCFSFLLVLLSSFVLFAQSLVYTSENLNMRDAPSTSANKVVTIPKHTAVFVIEEGKEEEIGGVTAKWKKVICDTFESGKTYEAGITGWVFSAYLSKEDNYSNAEIEKILFSIKTFKDDNQSVEPVVMEIHDWENNKGISIDYGWGSYCSTSFCVQNGKLYLSSPFTGDVVIRDEDLKNGPLSFTRPHNEKGEYCIAGQFYSKPVKITLSLESDKLVINKNEDIVLPDDCEFYSAPDFKSKKVEFGDVITFETDGKLALVYNYNRFFKGETIKTVKHSFISEKKKNVSGKWYFVNASHNLMNYVWIFVPDSDGKKIAPQSLTLNTLENARNKGQFRLKIINKDEAKNLEGKNTRYWVHTVLEAFPEK